jgi:HEAT repeat protein
VLPERAKILTSNSGNIKYRDTALKYSDSKSARVRAAAAYALKQLGNL